MSASRIPIEIPGQASYDVIVGEGLLPNLGLFVAQAHMDASHYVVLTDEAVAPLYLDGVKASLASLGMPVTDIVVPDGEGAKSVACVAEIWQALASLPASQDVCIIALGGGSVEDLAGFVAATYRQGVSFIQVPTTLLAMVDSSVGGKTAVNLPAGKNLVGASKQPALVVASLDTLATLPDREWLCGCGEIAKYSVADSDEFFFWLAENASLLATRDLQATASAIQRCVAFKARLLARDARQFGSLRECFGYGYTLGSAVESLAGFGTYSHGAAVAEGMRFAARLGAAKIGTPVALVSAQDQLLDALGLGVLSDFTPDPNSVLSVMHQGENVRRDSVRFLLPEDVGTWSRVAVEDEMILEHLAARNASLRS